MKKWRCQKKQKEKKIRYKNIIQKNNNKEWKKIIYTILRIQ